MRENEYWILLGSINDLSKAGINPRKINNLSPISGIVKVHWGHGYVESTSRQLTIEEDVYFIMGVLKRKGVTPIGIISS